MFTELEFMECPGLAIDKALADAASSDYWYEHEKDYGDDHYGGDDDDTECTIEDES